MNIERKSSSLNELMILFRLLTKSSGGYGASLTEMIKALGYKNETLGRLRVYRIMSLLSNLIDEIGLKIVYVPIRRRYVIKSKIPIQKSSVIPPGALATLYVIAKMHISEGRAPLDEISKLRGVSKETIKRDIRILEKFGLVRIDQGLVTLTDKAIALLDLVVG